MGQGASGPQGPKGDRGDTGSQGPKGEVSWNILTQDEKQELLSKLKSYSELRGEKGDTGPAGPAGPPGVSDPNQVATQLTANTTFINNLGTNIANRSTKLSTTIASEFDSNDTRRIKLAEEIFKLNNFTNTMAQKLSQEEPYRTQLKGESGDLGSDQAVRTALQPRTLWCADGEFCQIPTVKKGAELAGIRFSDRWSGFPDKQVNGKWNSEISNDTADYKQLMIIGNKSDGGNRKVGIWDQLNVHGQLGVEGNLMLGTGNKWILHTPGNERVLHIASWNNNDWDWGSQVTIQPNKLTIGRWSLDATDGDFRLRHDGDQKLVVHTSGKTWIKNGLGFERSGNFLIDGNDPNLGIRKLDGWDQGTKDWVRNF
jgi:hypothetical protein